MRRPVRLFARGPRDNGEFSALKQVLAHNSVVFPGENRTTVRAACLFLASFQFANIYKLKHCLSMQVFPLNFPEETFLLILNMTIPSLKQNALVRCSFHRPSLVGTSLFLFVSRPEWQLRG